MDPPRSDEVPVTSSRASSGGNRPREHNTDVVGDDENAQSKKPRTSSPAAARRDATPEIGLERFLKPKTQNVDGQGGCKSFLRLRT